MELSQPRGHIRRERGKEKDPEVKRMGKVNKKGGEEKEVGVGMG